MSITAAPEHARRRFAVVGAGGTGAHHALVIDRLADRIELAAVVDLDLPRARRLAAARGGAAFGSLTEALDAVDLDVVVVRTPTGRHARVAIEALDAGKRWPGPGEPGGGGTPMDPGVPTIELS